MMGVEWGAIAVALWLAGAHEPVRAPRELPITVEGCSDELAARLPALVSLEVDVLMRERGERRALPDSVAVRCAGGAAPIVIEVALAGARRESRVALGAMAVEHRARALALAVAELVDALAAAPPVSPPPAHTAEAGPGPPQPAPALLRAERATDPPAAEPPAVSVCAGLEWLGKPAALLLAARLAYQHRPYDLWRALVTPILSLGGSSGGAPSSAGHVAVGTIAAGAHALVGAPLGWLRVEGGPGFRVGWARLTGQPLAGTALEGRALSGWWAGPELSMRATTSMTTRARLRPAVEVSAGWVVLPIRGLVDGGPPVYAVQGPWLSLGLQLALHLR